LDDGIDDTLVSSVEEEVSFALIDFQYQQHAESRMPQIKTLKSIRKYRQYHRPIARPSLFWLNGGSLMSPGGLCHPSDYCGSKLEVLEIRAGYFYICCDE